jgi:hypothetical protein
LGLVGRRAEIEPWDDLAGGSLHPAEAYAIAAPTRVLTRLLPGRSDAAIAAGTEYSRSA